MVAGVLTVLYEVANFAFLPSIVASDQLVDANGKLEATGSASEIGGRGVRGLAVQALSAPLAVGANAVGYLASVLFLSRMRAVHSDAADPVPESASGLTTTDTGTAKREVW